MSAPWPPCGVIITSNVGLVVPAGIPADSKSSVGLGLSIAREIIEHMNGNISLDKSNKSDYPGACFLIILPVKQ